MTWLTLPIQVAVGLPFVVLGTLDAIRKHQMERVVFPFEDGPCPR